MSSAPSEIQRPASDYWRPFLFTVDFLDPWKEKCAIVTNSLIAMGQTLSTTQCTGEANTEPSKTLDRLFEEIFKLFCEDLHHSLGTLQTIGQVLSKIRVKRRSIDNDWRTRLKDALVNDEEAMNKCFETQRSLIEIADSILTKASAHIMMFAKSHRADDEPACICAHCHRFQVLGGLMLLLRREVAIYTDATVYGYDKTKRRAAELAPDRLELSCLAEESLIKAEIVRPEHDKMYQAFICEAIAALDLRESLANPKGDILRLRYKRLRNATVDATKRFRAITRIIVNFFWARLRRRVSVLYWLTCVSAFVIFAIFIVASSPIKSGGQKNETSIQIRSHRAHVVLREDRTTSGGSTLPIILGLTIDLIIGAFLSAIFAAFFVCTFLIMVIDSTVRALGYLVGEIKARRHLRRLYSEHGINFTDITSSLHSEPPSDAVSLFFHITDLHMFADREAPYEIIQQHALIPEGTLFIRDPATMLTVLVSAIAQHRTQTTQTETRTILATGDLTDSGSAFDWIELIRAAHRFPLGVRIIALPGNHDIAFNPVGDPDVDGYKFARRTRMWNRMLGCMPHNWDRSLPLSVTLLGNTAPSPPIKVISLDSCQYPARHMGSNAFGSVGEAQLENLRNALANGQGPVVVALHHHLLGYRETVEGFAMSIRDSHLVLDAITCYSACEAGNHVLVIHGHQHARYLQRAQLGSGATISVYCGPSSTMGEATDKQLDGVPRFACVSYSNAQGFSIQEVILPRATSKPE